MNNAFDINYFENSSKVGIEQINNTLINIYLPIGVTKEEAESDENFIYKLLNSILPAKKKELMLNGNLNSNNVNEWPIYSEIWLVKDYIYHGLYEELERNYNINIGGKINWKKTLNKESILYNDSIYYPNIVFERKEKKYTIITELQKYCLNLCVVGKYICKLNNTNFNINISVNQESINNYLKILKQELAISFEDHKKQLLNSLINILSYYSSSNLTTINSFITYEYHYSWEYMISKVFNNDKILMKNILPKSGYHPKELGYNSSLIPDTVFAKDDSIYILDSKYYSYGNTPNTSDICKQTEYCRTAKSKLKNSRYKSIYNSFILPNKVEEERQYVGYANMIDDDLLLYKINVIYLDTLNIINLFYEGKQIKNIDFLKINECNI